MKLREWDANVRRCASLPLMNADFLRLITVCRSLITKDGGEDLNANVREWAANFRES